MLGEEVSFDGLVHGEHGHTHSDGMNSNNTSLNSKLNRDQQLYDELAEDMNIFVSVFDNGKKTWRQQHV